jgi:hypothetical protein
MIGLRRAFVKLNARGASNMESPNDAPGFDLRHSVPVRGCGGDLVHDAIGSAPVSPDRCLEPAGRRVSFRAAPAWSRAALRRAGHHRPKVPIFPEMFRRRKQGRVPFNRVNCARRTPAASRRGWRQSGFGPVGAERSFAARLSATQCAVKAVHPKKLSAPSPNLAMLYLP